MKLKNDFFLLLIICIAACNPDEPVPVYFDVAEFNLTTVGFQGAPTARITDGWIFIDGDFLGVFPLPSRFPVLDPKGKKVEVFPGVPTNGSAHFHHIYPFYLKYEITVATDDPIVLINPGTSYLSDLTFRMVDDFETRTFFTVDLDHFEETKLIPTNGDAATGNSAGLGTMTREEDQLEVATSIVFRDLPTNGNPIYLEMDYKNDVEISVGLIGHSPGSGSSKVFFINLIPRSQWNKIYIDLTELVRTSELEGYQIVLRALHNGELSPSHIWIDNAKLIHR